MHGLTDLEVRSLLQQYGENTLHINDSKRFAKILLDIVREPMFLLLAAASLLYFILNQVAEGFMMITALCIVAAISLFEEVKSSKALEALQQLTEPKVKVIRNGKEEEVEMRFIVPGDLVIVEEGSKIPADAKVIDKNDLSVNESILTGESLPVEKTNQEGSDLIFQGTVVNSGRCIAKVLATGGNTELGKIGKSIITYATTKTELQKQIDVFVKRLAFFGIAAFIVIFFLNYFRNHEFITSLLYGLTLAMSAIPEEIPVAFSSFMALGAYHISRSGVIARQPLTVENLGAVNIICLDKTGTITENKMKLAAIYDHASAKLLTATEDAAKFSTVLYYGLLASEKDPFDPMEIAIVDAYKKNNGAVPQMNMTSEYPLQGHPPMMTHVYEKQGTTIASAKGGVERLIKCCYLQQDEAGKIIEQAKALASKGHRVLAVASATHAHGLKLPAIQDDFNWRFEGLLSLYDPPKTYVNKVFKEFYEAGINVKLLTGDFPETAMSIAGETGLQSKNDFITGEEVMHFDDNELYQNIKDRTVFARMFPEAKLRVIKSLIENGNIVAMTGDGVNDGPALKAANIGIAMGKKGSEVARQSADLIITDDDLEKLTGAIKLGRTIFNNLKKAIRYIISIHIPIILTASLPLLFGWKYPNVFTPIHVIFLELIMGPTCSIFFEREPVEEGIMKARPRNRSAGLFRRSEFIISILQGLIITSGILILYYYFMENGASLQKVRTIVFTTLILSNIFLTFANRSFVHSIFKTIRYKNNLVLPVLFFSLFFLFIIHAVPFIREHFGMLLISAGEFAICFATAFIAVMWFEIYKTGLPYLQPLAWTDHKHTFQ
jgi:P-type Ca2+ transporter type 2C